MQCQVCKTTTATIHLTEIVDGQRSEMHMCETCAQKQGLTLKTQIPINELLSSLLASQPEQQALNPAESAPAQSCPNCGITFEQFRQQSLLGCPGDYEFFQKQLDSVIKKSHSGHDTHCGKVPSKAPQEMKEQLELIRLKKELEMAISTEDYELAAKLRDRIKEIQ
jgi:protein arginine kinase activator